MKDSKPKPVVPKEEAAPVGDGYPVTNIKPKDTVVRGCGAAVKGNKYRK